MSAVFDAPLAERYDAFCLTPLGHYVDAAEQALLFPLLDLRPGLRVADLGCGTGTYTVLMANANCRAVGVDISPAMLAVARGKNPQRGSVEWVEADIEHLPFPDARFHRVLVHVTLEFASHPDRVVQEAWRVVQPGGALVVGLIVAGGPWAEHYRARAMREPSSVWRHARFWSVADVAKWLGRLPDDVRTGLWIGPEEFSDAEAAQKQEQERAKAPLGRPAGFAAIRWRRPPVGRDSEKRHRPVGRRSTLGSNI